MVFSFHSVSLAVLLSHSSTCVWGAPAAMCASVSPCNGQMLAHRQQYPV